MENHILVTDDDLSILTLISDTLSDAGYSVSAAVSGEEALGKIATESFDLIILDIMMKGISGLEVCRRVRSAVSCPILFLSAKDSSRDIIDGLALGADDYLTKPFVTSELLARINAHLRRENREKPQSLARTIKIGELCADSRNMTVTKSGAPVPLSTKEFMLLFYLMGNAGQTLSREKIFKNVWKTEFGDIGTVAINIKNLREKIDPDWKYIKTIWGSGYRFISELGFNEGTEV